LIARIAVEAARAAANGWSKTTEYNRAQGSIN